MRRGFRLCGSTIAGRVDIEIQPGTRRVVVAVALVKP
jgi:hypothetical protein